VRLLPLPEDLIHATIVLVPTLGHAVLWSTGMTYTAFVDPAAAAEAGATEGPAGRKSGRSHPEIQHWLGRKRWRA